MADKRPVLNEVSGVWPWRPGEGSTLALRLCSVLLRSCSAESHTQFKASKTQRFCKIGISQNIRNLKVSLHVKICD